MNEFERKCYGMSEADIRKLYMQGFTARMSGLEMLVMGMLSDCQEMLEHGYNKEDIRLQLNRAKFILGEMMQIQKNHNHGC